MKTSYKILIGVGAVVLLYVLWELYCAWQDGKTDESDDGSTLDADDYDAYLKSLGKETLKPVFTPSALAKDTSLFPIKYGSKGDNVRYIQRLYNEYAPLHGAATIADDGTYGDKTDKALSIAYNAFRAVGIDKAYIHKNIMTPTSDGHFTISQKQYTGYEYFMKVIMRK